MKKLVTVCKLSSMTAKKRPCAILELLGGAVYFHSSSGSERDGKKTVVIYVKAETSAVRKKSVCGRLQVFVSLLAQDETVVHTVKADQPHLLPGSSSGFRCDSATSLLEQITQTDGVVENETIKFPVEFEMRMMTPRIGFPTHPLGHEHPSGRLNSSTSLKQ